MPRRLTERAVMRLLRDTRRLKERLLAFQRSAQAVAAPLDRLVPEDESEAMVTRRANILGSLEHLLNAELGSVLRQLVELEGLVERNSQPIDLRGEAGCEPPASGASVHA